MEITARGLTFVADVDGPADGDPVLLLHGFPQNRLEWSAVTPLLWAAGLRTIAVDQRGYSPRARPTAVVDYRIEECALDAVAVAEALGYERVHLLGHDWGAIAAWHAVLRHPERVLSLTAVSLPHPFAMRDALEGADQRERSAYIKLFREEGKAEDVLLADGAARLRALFKFDSRRYVEPLLEPGALTGALNWYRAMSRKDFDGLGKADVPVTFVWSDGDIAVGPDAARACAAYVAADYRFVPVPGVSHWIPDEAPDVVADATISRVRATHPR
jgi:pimeloyl-ACP methyl ester carboxylesterase